MMRGSIARLLRRFRRDRKGVSAVEFALIAPLLIACYFGLAEMCGAMMAERKASQIASEMGDLVAQGTTINTAGINDIFSVATTVMVPMPTATLNLRISSITSDSTGKIYTVAWSKTQGAWATSVPATVPSGLIGPNGDIIKSEVQYTYASPVADFIKTPVTFNEVFYLAPRQSAAVTWQNP
jgi:Flp pilus assembly protein TadG